MSDEKKCEPWSKDILEYHFDDWVFGHTMNKSQAQTCHDVVNGYLRSIGIVDFANPAAEIEQLREGCREQHEWEEMAERLGLPLKPTGAEPVIEQMQADLRTLAARLRAFACIPNCILSDEEKAALDRAVAVEVMGWSKGQNGRWISPDGACTHAFYEDCDDYYNPTFSWSPSEDIAAAWRVMEKFTDSYIEKAGERYAASISGGAGYAEANTAPTAICLAALSAIRGKQ